MRTILLLILSLLSVGVSAGWEVGTIRFQHGQHGSSAESAGRIFFYLEGQNKNEIPACATFDAGERWVINNDWPAAKLQMSILLAASLSGKQVMVRGLNSCGVWSDTETVQDIIPYN